MANLRLRPFPLDDGVQEAQSGIQQFCEAHFEQRNIQVDRCSVEVSVDSRFASGNATWLWERLNALLLQACRTNADIGEVEIELVESNGVFDIELFVSSQHDNSATRSTWSRDFTSSGTANCRAIDCVPCPQGGVSWRARVASAAALRRVA